MRIAISKEVAEWPLVVSNGFLGTHDLCGNDPLHVAALHPDPCVIDSSKTASQVLNIGNAVNVHFLHGVRFDQVCIRTHRFNLPILSLRLHAATPSHRPETILSGMQHWFGRFLPAVADLQRSSVK